MVIDFHNHLGMTTNGLTSQQSADLLGLMDRSGIDRAVVFAMGSNGGDYQVANQEVLAACRSESRLIPFARLNPRFEAPSPEDWRLQGVRGFKVHADNDRIESVDLVSFLEELRAHPLPVLVHAFRNQDRWVDLFTAFPDIPFVMAHCGGLYSHVAFAAARDLPNVYLETSAVVYDNLRILLCTLDPAKILFGSDSPIHHPVVEQQKVLLLATPDERERIFHRNAEALLAAGVRC